LLIGDFPKPFSFPATAAGHASVAALKSLRLLPPRAASFLLAPALPLYRRLLRPAQARRLQALFAASSFPHLTVEEYYRTRLELLWRCLDLHGRDLRPGEVRVEGIENYLAALASNRPVTLLGLHLGVVEMLHRIPPAPEGRPFRILTAPAFSAPLTQYMARGRERDGKKILMNRGMTGLREVLEKKGVLAMMADQHPGRPEEFLHLWDRVAVPWPARLLRFLSRNGFVTVPVSTRLEPDGSSTYRFHVPWKDDLTEDAAMRFLARSFLEEAIAWAPEQWNWSYPKIALGS
jgi:lauroyl/myristoyl acyltransferase